MTERVKAMQEGYERFAPRPRRVVVGDEALTLWLPPDLESLIDLAAFEADERIPYWANLWESAQVLAEELAGMDGAGRRLVELGCGIGLPAIVAARRGFTTVASDYEQSALEAVRFNADRNAAAGLVTRLLDWRRLPDDLEAFDVVVAADVLYERHHAEALAATIRRMLAPGGTALVADPGRARAVAFEPAVRAAGLGVVRRPPRRPARVTTGPWIDLYRITYPE